MSLCFLVSSFLSAETAQAQPPDTTPDTEENFKPIVPEHIYTPAEVARDIGAPSVLTLHLHDVPPGKVFAAIHEQSGVAFNTGQVTADPVSIDCDAQPFWTVLPGILKKMGCSVQNTYDSNIVVQSLNGGAAWDLLSGPKITAGPFLLELTDCNSTIVRAANWEQSLVAAKRPPAEGPGGTQVMGYLFCDPKVRMLAVEGELRKAADDTGKILIRHDNVPMGYNVNPCDMQVTFQLDEPSLQATAIKALAGSLRVLVITRSELWRIPNYSKAGTVTKHFGPADDGLTLTLNPPENILPAHPRAAVPNDKTFGLSLKVAGRGRNLEQIVGYLQSGAQWFDAAGKPVEYGQEESDDDGDEHALVRRVTYNLAPEAPDANPAVLLAPPAELLLTVPTEIRIVSIPFSFADLSLKAGGFAAVPPERVYTPAELEAEAGLKPTLLTLHLHDATRRQLFDAVTAQSGIEFTDVPDDPARKVTVDCDAVPFWAEIPVLLKQTGFALQYSSQADSKAYLQPADRAFEQGAFLSGPQVRSGSFILELPACTINHANNAHWREPLAGEREGNPNPAPLNVEERLLCDPAWKLLNFNVSLDMAQDDTGKQLKVENFISQGNTPLYEPAPGAKSIARMAGNVRAQVALRSETWEIPDPVKAGTVTKHFGPPDAGLTLTFSAVADADGAMDTTLKIESATPSVWELNQTIVADMRWLDAARHMVSYSLMSNESQNFGNNVLVLKHHIIPNADNPNAPPVAGPVTLVFTVPTDFRTVSFPFEFHDLPLP